MDAATVNYFAALGTIVLQIVSLALLLAYLFRNSNDLGMRIVRSVQPYGVLLAFFVATIASAISLYYSAILGFEPCPLCWWQRAFLYPQIALFLIALWKKDSGIAIYSIGLSLVGLAIALYQHALQMLPGTGLPCPASGASCAQRIVFEFGYITFPLMAAAVFAFLIVLMLIVRKRTS